MTSLKQIEANRLNARKSRGPRTEEGKQRSRCNALHHGLTAETVVTAFESAVDYEAFEAGIASDYQPRSATERELVSRLVSALWRLRRSTKIETGLFQIEGELMNQNVGGRRSVPPPEWHDELDVVSTTNGSIAPYDHGGTTQELASSQKMADCYLRVSRLGYGNFDLLSRYETKLWRQAAQLVFMLQSACRR